MGYWRPRTEAQKARKRAQDTARREAGLDRPRVLSDEQKARKRELEAARRAGVKLPSLRKPTPPPRSEAKTAWGQERARKLGLEVVEPTEIAGRYRKRPVQAMRGYRLKFLEDMTERHRRKVEGRELYRRRRSEQAARQTKDVAKGVRPPTRPIGSEWNGYLHQYVCGATPCRAWGTPTIDHRNGLCLHCGAVLASGWFRVEGT